MPDCYWTRGPAGRRNPIVLHRMAGEYSGHQSITVIAVHGPLLWPKSAGQNQEEGSG
ncbi:MAG: hypothetical protein JWL81_2537 [Verrucomicrobiales bacterium]|nr:hypothetical protein [Verrucomicrobiales bacterium]